MAGLERKIKETEELIQIKRNAKNEFAYSMNRDILKTISNLSMEMMTLSQVSLKDNLPENTDNLIFMDKLRTMIDSKLKSTIYLYTDMNITTAVKTTTTKVQFDNYPH